MGLRSRQNGAISDFILYHVYKLRSQVDKIGSARYQL